jgi:hypothetical protein
MASTAAATRRQRRLTDGRDLPPAPGPPHRRYAARRRADGLFNCESIHCLNRYVASEAYHLLTTPGERTVGAPARPSARQRKPHARHPQGAQPSAQRLTGPCGGRDRHSPLTNASIRCPEGVVVIGGAR